MFAMMSLLSSTAALFIVKAMLSIEGNGEFQTLIEFMTIAHIFLGKRWHICQDWFLRLNSAWTPLSSSCRRLEIGVGARGQTSEVGCWMLDVGCWMSENREQRGEDVGFSDSEGSTVPLHVLILVFQRVESIGDERRFARDKQGGDYGWYLNWGVSPQWRCTLYTGVRGYVQQRQYRSRMVVYIGMLEKRKDWQWISNPKWRTGNWVNRVTWWSGDKAEISGGEVEEISTLEWTCRQRWREQRAVESN